MPKFAANLSFLFTELPFLDRFEAAAKAGFKAVEYLNPFEAPKAEIAARLKTNGLTQALFNMAHGDWAKGERGISAIPGREAEFEAAVASALDCAVAFGCRRVFAMAGLKHHGAQRQAYVKNLKRAARMAAGHGVDVIIEPINSRDIPGYFLNTTGEARSIILEAGEPNVGLQFDLYHRQIMEGDVAMAIGEFGHLARHYQIASPPDRGEPDDGELNYRYLFDLIDRSGFEGYVGCEYKPRKGTLAGLGWAKALGVSLS
ncbi:MAG: TIM barrel protein [Hyphomicrobiales bacterium]|nr:TIM barrel protein [Hyphomicrobiales bacterium]